MRTRIIATLLLLAVTLVACNTAASALPPTETPNPTATPQPSPTATPTPPPFRIVAYVTDAVIPQIIPYDQLTHINYAFVIPKADGSLQPLANSWKIAQVITSAHTKNVKVLISVGGWGWDKEFEALASTPETRTLFVQSLKNLVDSFQFDGVDMDWEFPSADSAQNFLALIQELHTALPDKLLTAAVVVDNRGGNAAGISAETFPLFDFLNVMAYDGENHGSMEQFENGLIYWVNERGLPKEKAVLGVPFYSHPQNLPKSTGLNYAKLVDFDPAAAQVDSFEVYGVTHIYNGIPTIKAKTKIALERASGIMFWTLEQDAPGDLSLVKAIYETAHEGP